VEPNDKKSNNNKPQTQKVIQSDKQPRKAEPISQGQQEPNENKNKNPVDGDTKNENLKVLSAPKAGVISFVKVCCNCGLLLLDFLSFGSTTSCVVVYIYNHITVVRQSNTIQKHKNEKVHTHLNA